MSSQAQPNRKCPQCQGTGRIELFTSVGPCTCVSDDDTVDTADTTKGLCATCDSRAICSFRSSAAVYHCEEFA